MKLTNCALWNESGVDVSFNPLRGNYGGTSLIGTVAGEGVVNVKTHKITEFFKHKEVFFMKIDVENSEEMVLKPLERMLVDHKIRHFVMEVRSNQAEFVGWFLEIGYACVFQGADQNPKVVSVSTVSTIGMADIYCTVPRSQRRRLSNGPVAPMPTRGLSGRMTSSGWT